MKKYLAVLTSLVMILSSTGAAFAAEVSNTSTVTTETEKAAILEQVSDSSLNSDGSVTIPLKNNESVIVDLGNGNKVEYTATIPTSSTKLTTSSTSSLTSKASTSSITTKTVSVKKTYWFYNGGNMAITFKSNCTWGNPSRTVKMTSLTDSFKGSAARMLTHSTSITVPKSTSGGTAEGIASGEIEFYNIIDGISLGTTSYNNTLYVDSADSSTLYLIED